MNTGGDIEDLLRRWAPQVLAALVRRYGHFETAEDAVREALLVAATQWPQRGVPDSPPGWLITVASRRMTDRLRSEWASNDAHRPARTRPDGSLVPLANRTAVGGTGSPSTKGSP